MDSQIAFLSTFRGSKVIIDKNCYITKTVVYGIADKRRPNNKKPLYRRKTIRIPTAYMINGDLVCHPEWEAAMRKTMAAKMTETIDSMTRELFLRGAGGEPKTTKSEMGPSPISWDGVIDALYGLTLLPPRTQFHFLEWRQRWFSIDGKAKE